MLATCFALAEDGMVTLNHGMTRILLETNVGLVPVDYYLDMKSTPSPKSSNTVRLVVGERTIGALERIMIHRTKNEFKQTNIPSGEIASVLGIPESEIRATGLPVQIVFSGIANLVVPVQKRETLAGMCPDLIKLRLLNRRLGVLTTDVFTLDAAHEGCSTYSRHFSPAMGMWEDDASGSGAASIASYLVSHGGIQPGLVIMEQGGDIDRLSRVIVEVGDAEAGTIPVQFGGLAVTSISREVSLEDETVTIT
jgi:PhzF family phenazine biosynthesis protein